MTINSFTVMPLSYSGLFICEAPFGDAGSSGDIRVSYFIV